MYIKPGTSHYSFTSQCSAGQYRLYGTVNVLWAPFWGVFEGVNTALVTDSCIDPRFAAVRFQTEYHGVMTPDPEM